MRITHALAAAAMVCTVWSAAAGQSAQPRALPQVDVTTLGPKVGEPVPDFTLKDQAGAARTLASVLGPSGGLLVFFRSADW